MEKMNKSNCTPFLPPPFPYTQLSKNVVNKRTTLYSRRNSLETYIRYTYFTLPLNSDVTELYTS